MKIFIEQEKVIPIIILLSFSLFMISIASGTVLINEVELDPIGNGDQWVELYNSGDEEVDIGGWSIAPLSDLSKEEVVYLTNLSAKGFCIVSSDEEWLDPFEETLILRNEEGLEMDRTPPLYDISDSDCAWGRYPDGSNKWILMESTRRRPSSGKLCEELEVKRKLLSFNMDKQISGSGFVQIHNSITSYSKGNLLSREHGSGSYKSEESVKYSSNLLLGTHSIGLNKSDFQATYNDIMLNISPRRSVRYNSKWTESSMAGSSRESPYISESCRNAASIDSDLDIQSKNLYVTARVESEFEGKGSVESRLSTFRSSEEYSGSFKVLSNTMEKRSGIIETSVDGEGFVDVNKKVGDVIRTYERGTGQYKVDEMIDATKKSLDKEISLANHPISYSYGPDNVINRSIMWREGTRSGECGVSYIGTDFSDITKLDEEISVKSSGNVKTAANFSGKARLQAAIRNSSKPSQELVYIDDEYIGNYSINRQITVIPIYKTPHMTATSQGHINKLDCDIIRYTITLVNDGNIVLGPVYLRDTFPSGTKFMDTSLQPIELTARYANWSIPVLGVGNSIAIDLDLQVDKIKENYTNRLSAITIYQQKTKRITRDRRLRASNSSLLEADWSGCSPQNISASFTVTSNPKQPQILSYRLSIQNLAAENMSANITALLPQHVKFVNSSLNPSKVDPDKIYWSINRLSPGKKRVISFIGEAEGDGLLTATARIFSRFVDMRQSTSKNINASILIGVPINATTFSSDWLSCGDDIIDKHLKEASNGGTDELECCFK